jgi:hypothetical protein
MRKDSMTTSEPARFTLEEAGHTYEVESHSSGLNTIARLFVDGVQVDEQKGMEKAIVLHGGGLAVVVSLDWLGNITEILAVPAGGDPGEEKKRAASEGIAFVPPPGSRAARLDEMRRKHPELYAARHVVLATLQVLVGFLGIGALLSALLGGLIPRLHLPVPDLPDLPLPDIDLPAIPWPSISWPDLPIPDLAFLAPLKELWGAVNWLVPIIIAIVVALNEVDKRRKRQKAEAARQGDGVMG